MFSVAESAGTVDARCGKNGPQTCNKRSGTESLTADILVSKLERLPCVSHERIYGHIWCDKNGAEIFRNSLEAV